MRIGNPTYERVRMTIMIYALFLSFERRKKKRNMLRAMRKPISSAREKGEPKKPEREFISWNGDAIK